MINKIILAKRAAYRKQKQKEIELNGLERTCHICGKTFRIMPDSILYSIDDKLVHPQCFFNYVEDKK